MGLISKGPPSQWAPHYFPYDLENQGRRAIWGVKFWWHFWMLSLCSKFESIYLDAYTFGSKETEENGELNSFLERSHNAFMMDQGVFSKLNDQVCS